ncbi:hypothetical protein [Sinorhizobium mexicanum]|uniref:Uncharacterized protein n=1 Tax=Sinorhizobium mexicanum TaxID=375549 RepID=A0A859QGM7_9HYPH|nr:hypothetical protein [Sinorhizobium mexicanum]MBP1881802.1 hypothetical protein [Sinorhizobium mexicanum]QLL61555.1 hypothetical protein FKV68_08890 [Sinorhizobium mexicanum]
MKVRGFEFGHLRKSLFAHTSSIAFNQHMVDAKVFACAYGYDTAAGYPFPVPALTIVGEKADKLLAASEILKEWGCEDDGDAVDIEVVLRRDGSYLFGMQPNLRRGMYRMSKDQDLQDVIFFGATWIKKIDSTNPILLQWKDDTRSKLSPVLVSLATAQSKFGIPQIDTIKRVPGALTFVKFDLKIASEEENPNHLLLDIVDGRKPSLGKPKIAKPREIAQRRQRVIDIAFAVSRDRVRRLKLHEQLVDHLKVDDITIAQATQAAINVQLSREWCGLDHYPMEDFSAETWWDRTFFRVEMTTLPDTIGKIEIAVVTRQLELDVAAVLRGHGAEVSTKFNINQRQFVRLGYGGG